MATIKDIAKILVSRHKLKTTDAELFLQSMVEVINEGLMEDRQVKIKGFGTFKLQAMKERASVNVNTGEKVVIGEHDKISFTPDNLIKEIVNKPFAQFDTVIINDETAILLENMPATDSEAVEETNEVQEGIMQESTVEVEMPVANESEDILSPQTNESSVSEVPSVKVNSITTKEAAEPVELIADSVRVVADTVEVVADKVKLQSSNISEVDVTPNTTDAVKMSSVSDVSTTSDTTDNQSAEETPEVENPVTPDILETAISTDAENTDDGDSTSEFADDNNNNNKKLDKMYSLFKYGIVAVVFFIFGFFAGKVDWKDFFTQNISTQKTVVDDAVVKHEVDSALLASHNLGSEEAEDSINSNDEKQEAIAKDSEQKKTNLSTTNVENKQSGTAKSANTTSQKEVSVSEQPMTEYNKDPRVKYGAYYIIGIDQTVTVKEGQTLKSISRAFLGPDMECYVEAYNGVKEVKPGQKIKIPKLKIKKIKK